MFNFNEAEDVSKIKRVQSNPIVIAAKGRISLTVDLFKKLDLANKRIHLLKSGDDFAIGSVDTDSMDGLKISSEKFVNQNMHKQLGGQYSEYSVAEEGVEHPISKEMYYPLTLEVNGAEKREELAAVVTEGEDSEESEEAKQIAEFEAEPQVEDETFSATEEVEEESVEASMNGVHEEG